MSKLKVMECFGGIGACTAALKRLGIDFEVVDYVEIDQHPVASYNAINGTNYEPQDISKWDKDLQVDLIMHGSPCTNISICGKQAGADKGSGTSSSLMYETLRIVEKLKPKYVVWENVKNLLSVKHKHNFEAYLDTMKSFGYTNYYKVLNAKDFGVPQKRERVFTISILGDSQFEFPNPQKLDIRLKDILEENVDEKYYLPKEKIERIAHWNGFQKPFRAVQGMNSICPTLTARGAGEEHNGMITLCRDLIDTTNLQDQCLQANSGNFNYTIRKLTPREAWRLMGFSDSDFDIAAQVSSQASLYKQAGNSIVVNVLVAIFKNLLNIEK